MPIHLRRLTETAIAPSRESECAVGFDLCADESVLVPEHSLVKVKTGIALSIDPWIAGLIYPHPAFIESGLEIASRYLDNTDKVEIVLSIFNRTPHQHRIEQGEAVAKILFVVVSRSVADVSEVA